MARHDGWSRRRAVLRRVRSPSARGGGAGDHNSAHLASSSASSTSSTSSTTSTSSTSSASSASSTSSASSVSGDFSSTQQCLQTVDRKDLISPSPHLPRTPLRLVDNATLMRVIRRSRSARRGCEAVVYLPVSRAVYVHLPTPHQLVFEPKYLCLFRLEFREPVHYLSQYDARGGAAGTPLKPCSLQIQQSGGSKVARSLVYRTVVDYMWI